MWNPHKKRIRPPVFVKTATCHICGNEWDYRRYGWMCTKCHTMYVARPAKSAPRCPIVHTELFEARRRMGISRDKLAKIIGCQRMTIERIERGAIEADRAIGKLIRERLRIWIESTKPPIDRRKEIDDMFKEAKEK